MKLQGKVAAVTGAASGIGLACARAMAEEGARVILIDRDGAKAEGLAKGIPGASALAVDLMDPDSVARMMPAILASHGRLDIFHANAGAYVGGEQDRD